MQSVCSQKISPFTLFEDWYNDAKKKEIEYPEAMSLATISADGTPSVRIVLMKEFSAQGFSFYTNLKSQKGIEISLCPNVGLNFHWKSIKKQVRIVGQAEVISDEVADQYFSSRPRASQIGAWASK